MISDNSENIKLNTEIESLKQKLVQNEETLTLKEYELKEKDLTVK